jgi:hypothetical protein
MHSRLMSCRCIAGMLVLLSTLVTGCNSGTDLVSVTGTITVDGAPADGAVILFHPEPSENKTVSSAVAKVDGTFVPVTDSEPGLPVGRYTLTVIWPDPAMKPTEQELMLGSDKTGEDLLKGRYVSKNQSTLTAEVTPTTTALTPLTLTVK